jgi:hypothetical protein
VTSQESCRSKLSGPAESWVLAASILGSSMAFIDGTVVNVALPALQGALGATAAEMQWESAAAHLHGMLEAVKR